MPLSRRHLLIAAPALILPCRALAQGAAFISQPNVGGPFDVFLIAGQSNAVGHGDGFDATLDAPSAQVFVWNYWQQRVQTAAEGVGLYGPPGSGSAPTINNVSGAGYVGFALAFAKKYIAGGKLTPGAVGVLLVPCAVDASGFANSYNSGNNTVLFAGGWVVPPASNQGGNLYATAITQANNAMAVHASNVFKGVLWNNGENEMNYLANVTSSDATAISGLTSALDAMIAYFRAHITGATSSAFVCGQVTQAQIAFWNAQGTLGAIGTDVDAVYAAVGSRNTKAAYWLGASPSMTSSANVNANGVDGGNVHFSAAGQRINAQNCYNAYASL